MMNGNKRIDRNAPCPCGSGKKYKQCCLKSDETVAAIKRAETASISKTLREAVTHHQAGRLPQAETLYQQILRIEPNQPEALHLLGVIAHQSGKGMLAIDLINQAIRSNPSNPMYYYNLGMVLKELGQLDAAVENYNKVLASKPDFPDAHFNLGSAFLDQGKLGAAITCFHNALSLRPNYPEALSNLGVALHTQGKFDEAVAYYHKALALNPDLAAAHSSLLFCQNHLIDQPVAKLLEDARRFGDVMARQARPYRDWPNIPEPDRCLRVGLVSGDFRTHAVGFFIEGVMAALAANASGRLQFIAYYNHSRGDAQTERIKACCHGWHSAAGLSDEALARQIHDDNIDILIDLAGHTSHNSLSMFAWKPAPLQATWLGYLGTTGVAAMDYLIADPWVLPETEDVNFTEKILRLPESYLCFTAPDADIQVSELPALANGYVTFGCFNNLTKINDAVIALWARLLASVPDSRLFLKSKQFKEASVRHSIIERFAAHGIDAQRLMLEGATPRRDGHLATYRRVDISLDPFPYPGITTSVESLWMGVPVLTLAGERFLSRQGIGILMNAGLPEWIAADADDYVARAAYHAADLPRLSDLRNRLRQQVLASPVFDAPRFAQHFEAALRGIWTQWCDQQQSS